MTEIIKLYNQEKIEMLLERLVRAIEENNRKRCDKYDIWHTNNTKRNVHSIWSYTRGGMIEYF